MKVKSFVISVLTISLVLASATPTTGGPAPEPPLREISYYPRDYAWLNFWPNWPNAKGPMEDDLHKIRELGANTVRIFLHPSVDYYPRLDPQFPNYFEEALALIDRYGLKAHVNLFDCWWSWDDIAGSKTWLSAIVQPHQNDPRIAIWELQNEVPLNQQVVRDWVQEMFPYLKQQAGNTPATVSVSVVDNVDNVEWLGDIKDLTSPNTPDIYSLHWYPSSVITWTTSLPAVLDRAGELIGSDELLLGEFGYETYTLSVTSQAFLYRDVLYYARQKGIDHLGAWTLNDFPEDTTQCNNSIPASDAERHFGLYRLDSSPKPAAAILRAAWGRFRVLNSSFEAINPNSGQVENWRSWDENWSGQQTFVQTDTTPFTGHHAVIVQAVATETALGLYNDPALPVELGRCYNLEGYVKTENLDGWAQIVLAWFDSNGKWLGNTRSPPITEVNLPQWTQIGIDKALPLPGAVYVQVYAQMRSSRSDSSVWFDDITITSSFCPTFLPLVLKQHGPQGNTISPEPMPFLGEGR
jgi:hypothetical protein